MNCEWLNSKCAALKYIDKGKHLWLTQQMVWLNGWSLKKYWSEAAKRNNGWVNSHVLPKTVCVHESAKFDFNELEAQSFFYSRTEEQKPL